MHVARGMTCLGPSIKLVAGLAPDTVQNSCSNSPSIKLLSLFQLLVSLHVYLYTTPCTQKRKSDSAGKQTLEKNDKPQVVSFLLLVRRYMWCSNADPHRLMLKDGWYIWLSIALAYGTLPPSHQHCPLYPRKMAYAWGCPSPQQTLQPYLHAGLLNKCTIV